MNKQEIRITEGGIQELGFSHIVLGTYEYMISSSYAGKLFLHVNTWGDENPYVFLYLEHTYSDMDSPIQIAVYDNMVSIKTLIETLRGDK